MIKLSYIVILTILLSLGCRKNNINGEPIPEVPVSETINIALPTNEHLMQQGTHLFWTGGVKGLVVVHHTDDQFYAFDRCCSHQPNNSCSRIEVDTPFNIFRCGESKLSGFEKCCDSKFFMDGSVFSGPATFGLKHYQVIRQGNILNIKN